MQLLLIRHGQTEWNLEGRYTGQSDIPLNETGVAQAEALVGELQTAPPTLLYSSSLLRARQTAQPLAEAFSLDIREEDRLREINQGAWEGMLFPDIKEKFTQEFAAQRANPTAVSAPGGETVGEVKQRVDQVIAEIIDRHQGNDDRIAIVCHGFVIALVRLYFGGQAIEEVYNFIPKNTEVIKISCT